MLAGGVMVGFASPASAVPACVSWSLDDRGATDYLSVYNNCSYRVNVKVVLANMSDFACYGINSGGARYYRWGYPGRFDGVRDC